MPDRAEGAESGKLRHNSELVLPYASMAKMTRILVSEGLGLMNTQVVVIVSFQLTCPTTILVPRPSPRMGYNFAMIPQDRMECPQGFASLLSSRRRRRRLTVCHPAFGLLTFPSTWPKS